MKLLLTNKKGGLTDIFLFMIITIILIFVSGIFIYIGITTENALHENMDDMDLSSNVSEVIDNSFDSLNTAYATLYWSSILIIVGMIISIFIGSYMVTTKPVFFIPYLFIVIVAIIISAGISNAYMEVIGTPELASVFNGFVGANFILAYFPLWITIIGLGGGLIMFTQMGKRQEIGGYY